MFNYSPSVWWLLYLTEYLALFCWITYVSSNLFLICAGPWNIWQLNFISIKTIKSSCGWTSTFSKRMRTVGPPGDGVRTEFRWDGHLRAARLTPLPGPLPQGVAPFSLPHPQQDGGWRLRVRSFMVIDLCAWFVKLFKHICSNNVFLNNATYKMYEF